MMPGRAVALLSRFREAQWASSDVQDNGQRVSTEAEVGEVEWWSVLLSRSLRELHDVGPISSIHGCWRMAWSTRVEPSIGLPARHTEPTRLPREPPAHCLVPRAALARPLDFCSPAASP